MEGSSEHNEDRDDSDACRKAAERAVLEVKPRKKLIYTILPSKAEILRVLHQESSCSGSQVKKKKKKEEELTI